MKALDGRFRRPGPIAAVGLVALAASCGPSPEDPARDPDGPAETATEAEAPGPDLQAADTDADRLMRDYLAGFEEVVGVFESVRDEASAQAASEALSAIGERLSREHENWRLYPDEELEAATKRYAAGIQQAKLDLSRAMEPVMSNPDWAKYFQGEATVPDVPVE